MEPQAARLRRVKEFARDAGVTVRTLHLYDRLGLLKPAATTPAGYRLYGERELTRLEHILAMRFVGFSLEQIKELLDGERRPIAVALQMQRDVIARRKSRLESALRAIDEARAALSRDGSIDLWKTLRNVIEVFDMRNDWEWAKNYYSSDAIERIEAHRQTMPPGVAEQGERDWSALIADVESAALRGVDCASAQARARRSLARAARPVHAR